MSKSPISLHSYLAYPEIVPGLKNKQPLLLSLKAEDIALQSRPPITLMLCVDLSGSMMGRPLELVIESIRMLLQHLTPDDRLGMVTFSTAGRLISPVKLMDPETRSFFAGVLSTIQAAGSTHMEEGLRFAFKHLPPPREGELVHTVLLSDGKPNRGMTDPDGLAALVERKREQSTLSGFGYGIEHDEDLLQEIVKKGGGGYAYVESADVAPLAFARELGSLFSTAATDLRLNLRPSSGCSILKLRGEQEIQFTDRGLRINLPDMIGGQQVHLLLDIQIQPAQDSGSCSFADIELAYTLPGQPPQEIAKAFNISYAVSPNPTPEMTASVAARLLLQDVSTAWNEAHKLADLRQFDQAMRILLPFKDRLKALPSYAQEGSEVRRWYDQVADEIEMYARRPNEERYRHVRKVAKSEVADPTGIMRKTSSSIVDLNTTQRELMSKLMQKVFGIPHAHLIVEQAPPSISPAKGEIFPVLGETAVGRSSQVKLDHPEISNRHSRLVATPGGYLFIDLNSTLATQINGKPIKGPTLLKEDDLIVIGPFTLRFKLGLAPHLKS